MDTSRYYPQLLDTDPAYEMAAYTQLLREQLEKADSAASDIDYLRGHLGARDSKFINVVFAGSSTINGGGASSYAKSVVGLTAKNLYAAYPKSNGTQHYKIKTLAEASVTPTPSGGLGIRVVNAGVGGTNSSTYLNSTTRSQVNLLNPAMIFHMVGSNDYKEQMPLETYKANMQSQISSTGYGNRGVIHVLAHAFPRQDVEAPTISWDEYGDVLREIAEEWDGVMFLDLSNPYKLMGLPQVDAFNLIGSDNVHLTDAGHAVMAGIIKDALSLTPQQQDSGWVDIATTSGFNSRPGFGLAYRVLNGVIHFRGGVVSSTSNASIGAGLQEVAKLSSAYGPGVQNTDIGASGVGLLCMRYAEPDGSLIVYPTSSGAGYVMFNGLSYPLEELDS